MIRGVSLSAVACFRRHHALALIWCPWPQPIQLGPMRMTARNYHDSGRLLDGKMWLTYSTPETNPEIRA